MGKESTPSYLKLILKFTKDCKLEFRQNTFSSTHPHLAKTIASHAPNTLLSLDPLKITEKD